jgi:hypothetical protein
MSEIDFDRTKGGEIDGIIQIGVEMGGGGDNISILKHTASMEKY